MGGHRGIMIVSSAEPPDEGDTALMAEGQRMTAAREAVEEILRCEHGDVLQKRKAWSSWCVS
ncbi:MAG: hypothetical protein U0S48_18255 [Solirubrobacteraceae bacterium]